MNVETREFSLPLESPLGTARGTIERREGFLVRIRDGDEVGVGEATPLPGWTESLSACRVALSSVNDPEAALTDLDGTPAARHGLSLALADLRAKRAGEPLYRHLDGPDRVEAVPVNATVGDGPRTETATAASDAVNAGFESVKVKVGARSVAEDAARLRAVREAVGPDVELRADANGAWSDAGAQRAFALFDSIRVAYVEQPLPAADLDGLSALRGRSVGVAVDETLAETPVEDALAADAADVFVCKPMVLGGVDRTVEAAKEIRDEGAVPVVTTTVDGVVARTAAIHAAAAIPNRPPCGLATGTMLARDLGPDRSAVVDGAVGVPQGPGNGVADTWGGP